MNRFLCVLFVLFLYLALLNMAGFAADPEDGIAPQIAQKVAVEEGDSATATSSPVVKTASEKERYDLISLIISVLMLLVASASFGAAIYFGIQNKDLREKLTGNRFLGLPIIHEEVRKTCKKIHKDGFIPDFIFSPDTRSNPVAYLVEKELKFHLDRPIPVLHGLCFFRKDVGLKDTDLKCFSEKEVEYTIRKDYPPVSAFDCIGITRKWAMFMPKYTNLDTNSKVLIVDDFCELGTSILKLKDFFQNTYGIDGKNIEATCLVTREKHPKPDFPPDYTMVVDDNIRVLPWGGIK